MGYSSCGIARSRSEDRRRKKNPPAAHTGKQIGSGSRALQTIPPTLFPEWSQ